MRRSLWSLILVIFCAPALSADTLSFTGKAFDLESDNLVYIERHRIELSTEGRYEKSRVDYFSPQAASPEPDLARKNVSFGNNPLLPELIFKDIRFGSQISLTREPERLVLEQVNGPDLEQTMVAVPGDELVVADAGFDRLVNQHWSKLKAGERIDFEFVALTRATLVSFRIRKVDEQQGLLKFLVEPQNWFFRMLVDPITLFYDRDSGRLRRFEGLTNIAKNADGDHYVARIEYTYSDEEEGRASP